MRNAAPGPANTWATMTISPPTSADRAPGTEEGELGWRCVEDLLAGQALEWHDLQHLAIEVAALETGARMTFPATLAAAVEDLARREAACCGFLELTSEVENDLLTLSVTTANPDGLAAISMLAGITLP